MVAPFFAGLGGLAQGVMAGEDELRRQQQQQYLQVLQQMALQQHRQQQQQQTVLGQTLRQLYGGQQQPQMQAQPQAPMSPSPQLPQVPNATAAMGAPGGVRGSWFGNYQGAQNWQDPSASGLQAGGAPVSAGPGIALPSRSTLGQTFDVTTPGGQTYELPQTDIGPAKWTGRGVEINAPAAEARGYTPQNFPTDATFRVQLASANQTYAQLKQSMPPDVQGPAQDATRNTLAGIPNPLQMAGRVDAGALFRAIDKANPDAPDEVKAGVFTNLYPMLSNQGKLDFQQAFEVYKAGQQKTEFETKEKETERYHRAMEGKRAEAGDTYEASKQLEITNADTGATRTVLAREGKRGVGWVDSITGQPIVIGPKEQVKEVTASTAGGGRAGAQLQRQATAGAEVKADLQNIADMPVGTTTGLFGSVKQGPTLMGATQGDLAVALSSEDEVNMKIAMAGVGRELSTLMSPVYSGNWASEQLEPMIPKAGYSVFNSLYGIARIKQSAINALDSLQPSPLLSDKQKEYARKLKGEIDEAIPWDVQDVIAFKRQGNPQESFGEFAARTVRGASSDISKMSAQQIVGLENPDRWNKLTPEQQLQAIKRLDELIGNAGSH